MTVITGAEIWNMIILLSILQGYILCALLYFSKKGNKTSNRLLATLILLMTLACTNLYMTEAWYAKSQVVRIIEQVFPFVMAMPMGPLIYFYIQSLITPDFTLTKEQKWHFSAVILDWVSTIVVWIVLAGLLMGLVQQEDGPKWGHLVDSYNTYSDIPRWLSITLYLLLAKRYLKQASAGNSNEAIKINTVQRKWIDLFLNSFLVFQGIWFVFLIPYIIPATRGPLLDTMSYYPIYIPLAILIYGLGLKGYLHIHAISIPPIIKYTSSLSGPHKLPVSSLSFSDIEVTMYMSTLKECMEVDKLYLEPSLNVNAVSAHTGLAQKTVSFILNNHLNKSFNEFVNEYRVEEVKKRLLEKGNEHLTISGIALECGFNSQATFQRVFKNSTGITPKEYISLQPQKLA